LTGCFSAQPAVSPQKVVNVEAEQPAKTQVSSETPVEASKPSDQNKTKTDSKPAADSPSSQAQAVPKADAGGAVTQPAPAKSEQTVNATDAAPAKQAETTPTAGVTVEQVKGKYEAQLSE